MVIKYMNWTIGTQEYYENKDKEVVNEIMAIIKLGSDEIQSLWKCLINMHVSYVMYLTIFSSSDLSLRLGLFLWICIAEFIFF